METKIKHKNKYAILAAAALALGFSSLSLKNIYANDSIAEIANSSNEADDNKEKIVELEKRAEIYKQIIDIKRQQSNTLNDQLSLTDSNIQKVQAQIDVSKQQINDYNSQIIRLGAQIKEKQGIIESQKKILSNLMQSYWESTQKSPINSYLSDGNFASFLVTKDQFSQTGDKIKSLVETVTELKSGLEAQSAELDKKKTDVVAAHQKLEDQSDDLQSVKDQRETLLAQTKGEEARYAKMLARVEEQKQELLNIDQLFSSSNFSIEGLSAGDFIEKNKPASSLLASTSWFYSQKDPRWANDNIGNSNSDMKNWGCAVTSVAMVAKFHGDSITPGSLAKKPIYSSDLIKWQMNEWSGSKIELSVQYGSSHKNLNWSAVDSEIKNGHPVIVYIGKVGGKGGHYVVIHNKDAKTGKYVVHDPYFGPNLYLDTSRALVGAMGVNTATYVDQMIIYN